PAQRRPVLRSNLFRTHRRDHRSDVSLRKYSALPFASTLNGSCTSVCPVKINIHEQIYKWRQVIAERGALPFVKREAMQVAGKVLSNPKLYRAAVETAGAGIEH